MKSGSKNSGFSLIEMVVVVAIIAILISMVFGIATRVQEQGKIRLCKDTLALVDNALEQFRDFGYEYKNEFSGRGLDFPLDCNNYGLTSIPLYPNLQDTIANALYSFPQPTITITASVHDPCFSGSEALYFILNQVPDCRATLGKIDKSLVTNISKGTPITIRINFGATSQELPFMRFIDPWKTPLRYDYYPDFTDYTGGGVYKDYRDSVKRTFPVITSAGPDKKFGTKDDITNR
jgi:prepilin-type N-terminal cleavage/methylation domain-containing protein